MYVCTYIEFPYIKNREITLKKKTCDIYYKLEKIY